VSPPLRGLVYRVDLGHGLKPWVVVSNNVRNRNLDSVLAARVTTTRKNAQLDTVVPLAPSDPLVGFVLCDDVVPLYRDELAQPLGALGPDTMRRVNVGLRLALALS
jgi:mRNA interferase MazF